MINRKNYEAGSAQHLNGKPTNPRRLPRPRTLTFRRREGKQIGRVTLKMEASLFSCPAPAACVVRGRDPSFFVATFSRNTRDGLRSEQSV